MEKMNFYDLFEDSAIANFQSDDRKYEIIYVKRIRIFFLKKYLH